MVRIAINALLVLALFVCPVVTADDKDASEQRLEQQRNLFRAVYPEAERGNWNAVSQSESVLKHYALWPDLKAAYFRARIATASHADIESFLNEFGVLKPARELRYRYSLHLAEEGQLAAFLSIYERFYQGLSIAKLDCLALQAEIVAGRQHRITKRALDLWAVDASQADECDPVFDDLRDRNLLTAAAYAERFVLAIKARKFTLARYLSKPLPPRYLNEANDWLSAQNQPLDFVAGSATRQDEDLDRRQLAYAIERLAYDTPLVANQHWRKLRGNFSFSDQQVNEISRHIALWSARLHFPQATKMLANLPASARNTESGRWLVRANLLKRDWREVVKSVDALPEEERDKSDWQYWKAFAYARLGDNTLADSIFSLLATERGYYGFLAADAISAPYVLTKDVLANEQQHEDKLSAMPELIRARELFLVGLDGRGRSEWDAAVRLLSSDEQIQAALLAHRWGWHSRAISTVATAGHFDDLRLRYPLPWREEFDKFTAQAGVPNSWAYGIARSESLFMRDVRSGAGAVGVMQLMPATGRQTAREIGLPYAGLTTLTDSSSNIRLGTWYLSKMYARFGDNRVLATAAYNAGPLRVENWLPEKGSLDARIWIENIPFNETRGYVRRVLTDDAIFSWRLTGSQERISSELPKIASGLRVLKSKSSD